MTQTTDRNKKVAVVALVVFVGVTLGLTHAVVDMANDIQPAVS